MKEVIWAFALEQGQLLAKKWENGIAHHSEGT